MAIKNESSYKGFGEDEILERKNMCLAYYEKYGDIGPLANEAWTELRYIYTIEALKQEIEQLRQP